MTKRYTIFDILAAAVLVFTVSCNGNGAANSNGNDTTEGIDLHKTQQDISKLTDTTGARLSDVVDDVRDVFDGNGNNDSAFVTEAITSNAEVIKLLQHGVQKGTNATLKGHAKKMIAGHNKIGEQLKQYGKRKKYMLPEGSEGKGNEHITELDKENAIGTEWDRAWIRLMKREHQKDIKRFERAENRAKDDALKAVAKKCLPTLRQHLEMIEELDDQVR